MLHHGLYEQVVNVALGDALEEIPEARKSLAPIDAAEASKVISQYMADIIKQGLEHVVDNGGDLASQVALANKIVAVIGQATEEEDFAENGIDARAEQLLAILAEKDPLLQLEKLPNSYSVRKPRWRKARYLPVRFMSRRWSLSLKRRLPPLTVLTCS